MKRVASACALLALAGCAANLGNPAAAEVAQEQIVLNPFDTVANRPEIFLTGELSGTLGSNGRCVAVATGRGAVTPLWPEGTRLERQGRRTLLVLPDGRGVAELGRPVRLGGGGFGPAEPPPLPGWVRSGCPANLFGVANVGD